MAPGKNLERLIAALERVLAGSSAKVEPNSRRLIDRDTDEPREFDVLITWDHGHHQITTAIECKDHSRPVGVPIVEAFAAKCKTAGVHHGVIVSTSGFASTARRKAEKQGIACMDLEEAESFDWLAIEAVSVHHRHFPHIDVRVMFKDSGPEVLAAIFDGEGTPVPQDTLARYLKAVLGQHVDPKGELQGPIPVEMNIRTEGWIAQDDEGNSWPIDHLNLQTTYETVTESLPLAKHRYTGATGQYAVASATADLDGVQGRFVMLKQSSVGETSIYWVPDNPSESE